MRKFFLTAAALSFAFPVFASDLVPPLASIEPQTGESVPVTAKPPPASSSVDDSVCTSGQKQSPVNISRYLQEDLPDMSVNYVSAPLVIGNNGETIGIKFDGGSHIVIDGAELSLERAYFRTPSEHYLDGAPYPMEVHFFHKGKDGRSTVMAVMMKIGAPNPAIEMIWQNVPAAGDVKDLSEVQLNPLALLPENKAYYRYEGSLTSAPCTEGVQWYILQNPVELSEDQLRTYLSVFSYNARPVQPLNGRIVTGD